ncbi:MAG TPA: hypothetical protein VER12_14385 [Polyangiaceae bacterium]|nr:hypothetical protein [Polyangiaceae bacterium]HYQ27952.1 hypothetical protein [Polyangiaceae bacterium]
MRRPDLRALLLLGAFAGMGACDGGDVAIFTAGRPGAPGGSAGSSGVSSAIAGGGSSAGALPAAGTDATLSGSGGGAGDMVGKLCQSNDDCGSTWLCQKQNCSDVTGVCLPLPLSDDPRLSAVCGCDDRTYFNDNLRQQRRVSLKYTGECLGDVMTCATSDECGIDGSCSLRVSQISDCSKPGMGQCWVVPLDCESTLDRPHFLPCPPPGTQPGSAPPPCLNTCQAVQAGVAYLPVLNKDACH